MKITKKVVVFIFLVIILCIVRVIVLCKFEHQSFVIKISQTLLQLVDPDLVR